ncbi:MAG: sensor histidine kinase KdpD [Planctomycetes bacterium]|nr:sensor histidine kinase KdpD [Planctomycetota bacterium]MBI3833127.1 sensor histidine kinase KdpD [Planctomycetota bacterium]
MSQVTADARPDPDALLAHVETREGGARRGRLKIFFGASPGVGKTYAMLSEAQEKCREGIGVVVGYVETHGRKESDALLTDLEQLPPQFVEYRGVRLREFDLDAALRRKPELILVDELAHTNAEGLRHGKRWQDVIELLDAGINVDATLNVQHIESLNDVVAQITGVIVRETVPDSIVERADEIELVDLPPDDLLQRLHEGKVYMSEQARRAINQFFRRENLVALRELALRQTAERVGAQVGVERAGRGERRPWPTSDRILVCVGPSPLSGRVVRTARRMAASAHAEWIAVSVETPRQSEKAAAQIRRNLQLAERLGAEATVLSGERVVDELLSFAGKRNINKIVIGKPEFPRWREWLRGSIVDELIRRSGDIDVHVVKGESEEHELDAVSLPTSHVDWREYAWTVLVMAVCTAIAALMYGRFSAVNLTMIYLAGVVFVATRFAIGPSVVASILAALLFDFLFTEPFYSLAISDVQYVIAFIVLLATALVISGLTQRVRRQIESARRRYLRTIALYFMSRQLAAAKDSDSIVRAASRHVADVFEGDVAVLLSREGYGLSVAANHGDFKVEPTNERAAAQWGFDHQKWAGWSTETLSACAAMYVPLVTSGASLGVLALRPKERKHLLEPDQRHLLETFATQLAIALERTAFATQAATARHEAETEQMRSALLSCVSHDLRTPLAAIAGAASTLIDEPTGLSVSSRRELLQSISDEAGRLDHLVGKLLGMTRLESPGFKLEKDWYPLEELVGSALNRLRSTLSQHEIETSLPADLPLLRIDGVLIEEVLTNMLENVARYTPQGSKTSIRARAENSEILVEVIDTGPGLPPGAEKRVFRRFVRQRPPTDRSGTGLGLAICDAVIRLHGGNIGAENRTDGGARFWFTIPLTENQPEIVNVAFIREPPVPAPAIPPEAWP